METWTIAWAFRNFVAELLMPPGIWLLCILLAVLFLKKRAALQKIIIVFSVVLIWVCSTPAFVQWFTHISDVWMHWPTPLVISSNQQLQNHSSQSAAIVVLGGGRRKGAIESPQYQNQDLSAAALERLRIGARLARASKLPILLTGGAPDRSAESDLPEAEVMAQILEQEFYVKAKWLETKSQTTQENAQFSAAILKREGIQTIYLVTHFWYMPRAQKIFEQYSLKVIPVPHGFHSAEKLNPTDFYPTSITETRQIWHELIGVIWYRLRY
jgi:uncharacterized SAM-binding protein YcdF (DUF218 family)